MLSLDHFHAPVLNLQVLQRQDPAIIEIIDSLTFVAVYKQREGVWERYEAEGCLFVVSRSVLPVHRLVVLNRLNPTNFVVDITPAFEWQRQGSFLSFRHTDDAAKSVYALWFNTEADMDKFVGVLHVLPALAPTSPGHRPSPVVAAVTIALAATSVAPAAAAQPKPKGLVPAQVKRPAKGAVAVASTTAVGLPITSAPAPVPTPVSSAAIGATLPTAGAVRVPVASLFAAASLGAAPVSASPPPQPAFCPTVASLFAAAASPVLMAKPAVPPPGMPAPASASAAAPVPDKMALKAALLGLLEDDAFLSQILAAYTRQVVTGTRR